MVAAVVAVAAVGAGLVILFQPDDDEQRRASIPDATAPVSVPPEVANPEVARGRVVVVGDSAAHTLLPGLHAHAAAAGLEFVPATATGCPLDIDAFEFVDHTGPVGLQIPAYCDWRATWPGVIERIRPELVVALWGLWDTLDHLVAGELLVAGSAAWNAHMTAMFDEAVDVLAGSGARVVVLTTPYVFGVDHARVDALNAVFRAVAADRPDLVAVVDMQPAVDQPGAVRWDGVHFTEAGAGVVAGQIVPELEQRATG